MALSVRFYLDRPHSERSSIYARIGLGTGPALKYKTECSIYTIKWDRKRQRVKMQAGYPEGDKANTVLQNIENLAKQLIFGLEERTSEALGQALDEALNRRERAAPVNFRDFYHKRSEYAISGGRKKHLRSKGNVFREFEQYQIDQKRIKNLYTWLKFKIQDFEQYKNYLLDVRSLAPNTVNDHVKILHHILEVAFDDGLHDNPVFRHKRFKGVKKPGKSREVYLTPDQIKQLRKVPIESEIERNVRDAFCLQCVLMLRFGDSNLHRGQIFERDGKSFIHVGTEKDSDQVVLNLPDFALGILNEYGTVLPQYPKDVQVANRIIKRLCERVGFDSDFTRTEQKGRVKQKVTYKFYEKVSSHSARRSAATNMWVAGEDRDLIRQLGGWSSIAQMEDYIQVDLIKSSTKISTGDYSKLFN